MVTTPAIASNPSIYVRRRQNTITGF
jgi:hypothetical protein